MAETGPFIVKLCGLPWSTTKKEVYNFLKDCTILNEEKGIHITLNKDGRPSGDCFVELASPADVHKAKSHSNENMGKRYIIISDAKQAELAWFRNSMPGLGGMGTLGGYDSDAFVKLRGLPFESTAAEIAQFFTGLDIAAYGITITMDQNGSPSGEAYVQFKSNSEVEKALKKNKEKIRHRYIEIFKSSKQDVKYVTQSNMFGGDFSQPMGFRPGPYDRPGGMAFSGRGGGRGGGGMNMGMSMRGGSFGSRGSRGSRGTGGPIRGGSKKASIGKAEANNSKTGHMIHMRGIPFECSQGDIYRFLAPLIPNEIRLLSDESGRSKGQAEVDFDTHSDAVAAMAKDKQNMGHRYIEIFLKSEPSAYDEGGWSNNNMYSQMNNPNGYYW